MGWFERIAAQDLKLRLIVGPAVITFATALVAGVFVLGRSAGRTSAVLSASWARLSSVALLLGGSERRALV